MSTDVETTPVLEPALPPEPEAYRTTVVGLLQPWPLSLLFNVLATAAIGCFGFPMLATIWGVASFGLDQLLQALYRPCYFDAQASAARASVPAR